MPAVFLSDQHDKPVSIGPATRWVIFASDKAGSDLVTAVLAAEAPVMLDRLQLVYLADISAMPAMVTRMFALPKLRELSFPIALVRDPAQVAQAADLPRQAGSAAVLRLERQQIAQIIMVGSAEELRAALGLTGETVPGR
jgi:NADPH-dependent ferric siderophore reductase